MRKGISRVKRYAAQRSFNIEQKKRTTTATKSQTAESGSNNTKSKKLKTPRTRKVPAPRRTPLTLEERKERQHTQFKEKLEKAKSLGLCRRCGEPAIQGQTRCDSCAESHRQARRVNDTTRRARESRAEAEQLDEATGASNTDSQRLTYLTTLLR